MTLAAIMIATALIAYANGANDNFKGVATLLGSGTTNYKNALAWATVTTLAGSFAAFFFATRLVETFSGAGLVPKDVTTNPEFLTAVLLGAGATIFVATFTGIPVSTTHSLVGALVGAGWMAVGGDLGFQSLGNKFFVPLVASPLIAVALTVVAYLVFRFLREKCDVRRTTCLCVGKKVIPVSDVNLSSEQVLAISRRKSFDIIVDQGEQCRAIAVERYNGNLMGVEAQTILDSLHFFSTGAVSFARGLNDTPKIVALAVAAGALNIHLNIAWVAILMAVGGLFSARKVARTMSHRITGMNHGQGFTANFITAVLVIIASRWGIPVSTTHVSCGSLFGIGLVNGQARWKIVSGIVSAWVLTLPISAIFAAGIYYGLQI